MQIYLVGGAVRDQLLNRPVKERDWVVVGAKPEDLTAKGFRQVGKDFPVFLHPETGEEYALARTERKTGQGYTGFSCFADPSVSLEDDLLRRDLTINAMAMTEQGEVIDPFGGQQDLTNKMLRHVSPAFIEDPLRVLRVARFAARYKYLDFNVAAETLALMQTIQANGELEHLIPERVNLELMKALEEQTPSEFFYVLHRVGADQVIFPEIACMDGIPNPEKWHPEIDTFVHCMLVIDRCAELTNSVKVRFAALMHDLGKGITPPEVWPSHPGHEEKGAVLVEEFCERFKVAKDYRELAVLACRYHTHCHRVFELKPQTIVKTLENLDAYRRPDRFNEFLISCEADYKGRDGFADQDYPQKDLFLQAYKLTKDIDVSEIIAKGFSGAQIASELHQQRVAAVKQLIKAS